MTEFNIDKPAWQDGALCRHYPEIEFIPDINAKAKAAIAKAVCVDCPVARECLEYALDNGEVGVWGGTDDKQRKAMRKAQRRTVVAYIRNEAAA